MIARLLPARAHRRVGLAPKRAAALVALLGGEVRLPANPLRRCRWSRVVGCDRGGGQLIQLDIGCRMVVEGDDR